jgi:hypothetical protein
MTTHLSPTQRTLLEDLYAFLQTCIIDICYLPHQTRANRLYEALCQEFPDIPAQSLGSKNLRPSAQSVDDQKEKESIQ